MLYSFRYTYLREVNNMKKFLSFLLVFCLVLGCAVTALAASPKIEKQPVTQKVKKGGSVSFTFKPVNQSAITWYFVNPETSVYTPVSQIVKTYPEFKGLRFSGQNSKRLIMKKVPEGLHGWWLFVRIKGNGKTVNSEMVQLLISGKDTPIYNPPDLGLVISETCVYTLPDAQEPAGEPETAPETASEPEAEPEAEPEPETEPEPEAEPENDPDLEVEIETEPEPETKPEAEPESITTPAPLEAQTQSEMPTPQIIYVTQEPTATPEPTPTPTPEPTEVVITARNVLLYRLDDSGNPIGEGVNQLIFDLSGGSFKAAVKEGDQVLYWQFDGNHVESDVPATSYTFLNVKKSMSISAKVISAAQAARAANLDYNNMVRVTCEGCYFSFSLDGIVRQTEGEVPSGAEITVIAGAAGTAAGRKNSISGGYSVNGGAYDHVNKATFKLVVTEDTTITMKK